VIDLNALAAFGAALAAGNWIAALATAEAFASKLTHEDLANLEDDAKTALAFFRSAVAFASHLGASPPDYPALDRTDQEWPNPMPQPPPGPETGTGP